MAFITRDTTVCTHADITTLFFHAITTPIEALVTVENHCLEALHKKYWSSTYNQVVIAIITPSLTNCCPNN
jgi:hypothetical protein